MYENARLFFSITWLVATGCLLAAGLAVLLTWGDFLQYLYVAALVWGIATIGAVVTSL